MNTDEKIVESGSKATDLWTFAVLTTFLGFALNVLMVTHFHSWPGWIVFVGGLVTGYLFITGLRMAWRSGSYATVAHFRTQQRNRRG